ncbi:lytic transglycosylase domain-containing protein [Paraburkholderia dinghuensis]|uniref:Transglycosylase SLT domain-containing protein n=1 Tax=Paraburkholderia dinghuensis TaxID=2305225 RepID=A0A3N6MSG6_9BURK|nr:transglycosylase SLT domain-containing protein [Paraburkholderia dinghuensis]RQH06619.1 hypothetical protein D1Y85_12160 [Paraburkholderia dinghuensis]
MNLPADLQRYIATAQQAGNQYGVPPELLVGQMHQESNFNPNAVSPSGAVGISQFMPATAKEYGIDPRDPVQSIGSQAQMMRGLYNRYGSWRSALQAYNWGQGNMDSYLRTGKGTKGQPMPAETQAYPDQVFGHARTHAGGRLPASLASAALESDMGGSRDLLGSSGGLEGFSGSSGIPSSLISTPRGPHVAMPSTQEEHDMMSSIASRGYAPDVEQQIVKSLAQLLPARDSLSGRDMLGDGGLPDDLDPVIRDIVDKA